MSFNAGGPLSNESSRDLSNLLVVDRFAAPFFPVRVYYFPARAETILSEIPFLPLSALYSTLVVSWRDFIERRSCGGLQNGAGSFSLLLLTCFSVPPLSGRRIALIALSSPSRYLEFEWLKISNLFDEIERLVSSAPEDTPPFPLGTLF